VTLIPNNQDLTAASGVINHQFLEGIYHAFMDEALMDLGEARQVIFHLEPEIQQDDTTQSKPAPQQYNPFFHRTPVPGTNTRNTGVRVTPRDVSYNAHIRIGPMNSEDESGMGNLLDNEIQLTVVIEALPHVNAALTFSVEGRRYQVDQTRPIGFSVRRYLMIKGSEIQETEQPVSDITMG
jgi:hypothetical protein